MEAWILLELKVWKEKWQESFQSDEDKGDREKLLKKSC
jgi:hypothetical protein